MVRNHLLFVQQRIYSYNKVGVVNRLDRILALAAGVLIHFYQLVLSPVKNALFGATCRFYPTCSEYARQCFARHSFWRACYLVVRRVGRCHPLHQGGDDPVPPRGGD